jgi:hypothetical protein
MRVLGQKIRQIHVECVCSYRNMFSGKSAIDLKNLDAESLSTIKSHYNLFESDLLNQNS